MRQRAVGRWWVGIVVLTLFGLMAWRLRPGQRPRDRAAPADERSGANRILPAPAPSAPAASQPDSIPAPASAETDPYGMPPPSPDQIRPVPAPPVVTEQDHQATRQAARELVENGIARLTSEGQQAAQSGDTTTAQRNQLRVARLRKRLAMLQQETAPAAEQK